MKWADIFRGAVLVFWLCAFAGYLYQSRRLQKETFKLIEILLAHERGMTRVVSGLAQKINANGHVDLSEEEWQATEDSDVTVIPQEGGIRVLAK